MTAPGGGRVDLDLEAIDLRWMRRLLMCQGKILHLVECEQTDVREILQLIRELRAARADLASMTRAYEKSQDLKAAHFHDLEEAKAELAALREATLNYIADCYHSLDCERLVDGGHPCVCGLDKLQGLLRPKAGPEEGA